MNYIVSIDLDNGRFWYGYYKDLYLYWSGWNTNNSKDDYLTFTTDLERFHKERYKVDSFKELLSSYKNLSQLTFEVPSPDYFFQTIEKIKEAFPEQFV